MVVVLDEYGQTSGLVAMEDILEEIVGNILDEYDEEDEMIKKQNDGSMIVNGLTELEDLELSLIHISVFQFADTFFSLFKFILTFAKSCLGFLLLLPAEF